MTQISPARLVAAQVLQHLKSDSHAQAADLINEKSSAAKLREDDARLARAIVFGVLRHAPTLDYYYALYLKKPPARLAADLRLCLRMAACQHFLLSRIPPYAIVNETVALARSHFKMKPPQVGFLNAVLRKLVSTETPRDLPRGNRINDLVIRYGIPDFYVRLLVDKYGIHKAIAIMEAAQQEPMITLRVNRLRTSTETLKEKLEAYGFQVTSAAIAPDSLVVTAGAPGHSLFDLPEFHEGHFYVQDEASQLVAHIVAPKPGERVLDLCAAPGGKTTHMAELAGGEAEITATDASPDRLRLVSENIQRLHTPRVSVTNLQDALETDHLYDAILVDAPCSGAGTVRRNPEIAGRLTNDELQRHAARQLAVLETAAGRVRPGGRVIYSTCSISPQENTGVVEKFLAAHPEFQIASLPARDALVSSPAEQLRTDDGYYRTWPSHPEVDGFEAVVLMKKQAD